MDDTQTPETPPEEAGAWEDLLTIREAMTRFGGRDLTRVGDDGIRDLLVLAEEITRMQPATCGQPLVRQVTDRGMDATAGCRSVTSYLQQLLRIRRGEAAGRVRAVERFQPRTQLTGETLPPKYPAVAAAMGAGEISGEHARVIAASLERLPAAVPAEARKTTEEHLVDCAREWDPIAVSRRATYLEAILDPDGQLATETEQRNRRSFSITKSPHGMWRIAGQLDPESANTVQVAIEQLSRPKPGPDGAPDSRSPGQRRADALELVCRWSLNHEEMPTHGGRLPQITATVTLADLEHRAGVARLNNGDPLSIPRLLEKAGQVSLVLAVFGHHGEVLHYGTSRRTATGALRQALEVRDRGCAFDGCDAPALWTQTHHVALAWRRGGGSDIDKLGLFCAYHHRLVEEPDTPTSAAGPDSEDSEQDRWRAVMINGIPHTIPPTWIDPKQRPRRNRAHDPP